MVDFKQFHLENNYIKTSPQLPNKRRIAGNFLKGPIPLDWLQRASALPGKAFQLGIVLWYLSGLRKNPTITLGNGLLENFHISRQAKYRCLKALEEAGLIAVEYRENRNPHVTILVEEA